MRLALTIFAALLLSAPVNAADIAGTWKLDIAKSKLHNPVQSYVLRVDQTAPNTYNCVFDVVNTKGEKRHVEILRVTDGKEHPVKGVNMPAGMTEIVSPDLSVVQKLNGKVVGELKVQLSPDGKTNTATQTITDANGNSYQEVLVFDKQ